MKCDTSAMDVMLAMFRRTRANKEDTHKVYSWDIEIGETCCLHYTFHMCWVLGKGGRVEGYGERVDCGDRVGWVGGGRLG